MKSVNKLNVKILKAIVEKKEKLKSKREEVERKARRGEIDPMHEHAIQNISQVRGITLINIKVMSNILSS